MDGVALVSSSTFKNLGVLSTFLDWITAIICYLAALVNQNAAASLLTRTGKRDHITPVLTFLH